jgi:glycosyltransferase involved in cell wall biosynthesis
MTIGAVLVVRNEEAVIERCLRSVQWVKAWVVHDTGSTDGTLARGAALARDLDVPWAFQYDEWSDFATNRNLALANARRLFPDVRYFLSLDADEVATLAPGANPGCLEADLVYIDMVNANQRQWVPRLIRADSRLVWQGRCHEHPWAEGSTSERWEGIRITHVGDGHDSTDNRRLVRNEALLRADLDEHPGDPRLLAYLGQTLMGLDRHAEAAELFRARAGMAVFEEEAWWAHYQWGLCQLATGDWSGVDTLLRACDRRPWRGEPLADLASHYYAQGCGELAKFFASAADSLPYPHGDALFIENALYNHELRAVVEAN